jgi:hypothetical protein
MTTRDDLLAQVEQALRDVPLKEGINNPDYPTMANAAVEAFAIYLYVALASDPTAQVLPVTDTRTGEGFS